MTHRGIMAIQGTTGTSTLSRIGIAKTMIAKGDTIMMIISIKDLGISQSIHLKAKA
jgi:hypothetical protein